MLIPSNGKGIICSYGAGINSTALIIEAFKRGTPPDLILFADTGSEMPHTYQFLDQFDTWLRLRGSSLVRVRWERVKGENKGRFISLEDQGLGRTFPWRDYIGGKPTGACVVSAECGCHDDSNDREE